QKGNRSKKSTRLILRSLFNLAAQLLIPMFFYVGPATVMFFGLLADDLLSFEVLLVMFLLLPCHSIAHNLILLAITSTYRRKILNLFSKSRVNF
ncbi:hypothetical protein PMAYCL1PPCAC_16129, partial [Pristionchus mayeri]